MGVNFPTLVYLPCFETFSIPVTFIPVGGASFKSRGIWHKRSLDVQAEDGSIFSDHRTELDIREVEFNTLPQQGDVVVIPVNDTGAEPGEYEIIDTSSNGGGETTLTLRKWVN